MGILSITEFDNAYDFIFYHLDNSAFYKGSLEKNNMEVCTYDKNLSLILTFKYLRTLVVLRLPRYISRHIFELNNYYLLLL